MNTRKRWLMAMGTFGLAVLLAPTGTLLAQGAPADGAAPAADSNAAANAPDASADNTASGGALQEVVVTAERRETNIQTTPISLSAISGDSLRSQQLETVSDLQKTVPNMQVLDAGTYQSINIRGIGNTAITPTIVPGVAVLHDGLLADETIFIGEPFYDIADVEVLRGPQGTLVGASSTGGAVEITSQSPNFRGVNGYAEAMFGSYNDEQVDGAVNLPISDTFAARIALNWETRSSFYRVPSWVVGNAHSVDDIGGVNNHNARISLLWKPTDSYQALFKASLNYGNPGGAAGEPNQYTFPAAGALCPNGPGPTCHSAYWAWSTHQPFVLNYNLPTEINVEVIDRYSLDQRVTFRNGVQLRSLTGFQHNDGGDMLQDDDYSAAPFQTHTKDVGPFDDYYSQEFSLQSANTGKLQWLVGAIWFYRNTPVEGITYNAVGSIGTPTSSPTFTGQVPAGTGGTRLRVSDTLAAQRTEGVYGNIDWEFLPTLQLEAGLRGNWDQNFASTPHGWFGGAPAGTGSVSEVPISAASVMPANPTAGCPAGYNCTYIGNVAQQTDSVPTGKVGINWTPAPGQFVYAFWARGYKSGGVIIGKPGFAPEKVDDYELGWKSSFLDNHVQTSVGGYWMRYQDMQLPTINAVTGANAVTNFSSPSTIRGIEVTANGEFGGFGTNLSLTWDKSTLGSVNLIPSFLLPSSASGLPQCLSGQTTGCFNYNPYVVSLSGTQNPYTPKFSADLTLNYRFRLTGNSSLLPSVTYSYTGPQFDSVFQTVPQPNGTTIPTNYYELTARHLLNVSLTYNYGEWQLQAFCNNCANQVYVAGAGGVSTGDVWYYGAPRQYGLRINRGF